MTLKSFLKTMKEGTDIQIVYPLKIVNVDGEYKTIEDEIKTKPHLFDVVSWEVQMNNYKPLVVVNVR